jgi:hypothetical protein
MERRHLTVACGALLGSCLGIFLYHFQNPDAASINLLGVISLASLGTSCGCLIAEPGDGGWL